MNTYKVDGKIIEGYSDAVKAARQCIIEGADTIMIYKYDPTQYLCTEWDPHTSYFCDNNGNPKRHQ